MNFNLLSCLMFLLPLISFFSCSTQVDPILHSPDKNIVVTVVNYESGEIMYSIDFKGRKVLKNSRLGILREDTDFTQALVLKSVSEVLTIEDEYELLYGKKNSATYRANKKVFHYQNSGGENMDIIFQVSNDGVAFRYLFPVQSTEIKKINKEMTSFHFIDSTLTWIQPRAKAKTGWNQVNPSYEEHYFDEILLTDLEASENGWVFPALFKAGDCWVNITETWPDRNYCGSHLIKSRAPDELTIDFPEASEGFTNEEVYPESKLPWSTPWRVITIGENPGVIAESTLGSDLADPSMLEDVSFVNPGRASWSWALGKDASVNYNTQKEFIEYAGDMGWEYCLIDVFWDTAIGWDNLRELAALAKLRDVGLILWYSSSGDWNTVTYHPKDLLLTSESRNAEFNKLKELGIKGIKVDFFGGDGQSMLNYYRDILEDAYKYQLVVNCHGATLPRGLQRTYPNLVSMESIRGFEFATFGQESADRVPVKSTIIPFTRNAFDPMDFTPVCFTEYDNNTRITGNGAELAQAVIFLSGVQHYAETPEGMESVPDYVKQMMSEIPVSWDDTKFIEGYPGDHIVIARRKGTTWYVAGINGENKLKSLSFDLPFDVAASGIIISEGDIQRSFSKKEIQPNDRGKIELKLNANGGFVARWGL